MHDVLMITYRRPAFTRLSLARLLDSCDASMRVWLWHNGNDAATIDIVRSFEHHPRFHRLHISPENLMLRAPTNWFWEQSDGDFLSKVDDDCLVPDGWGEQLREVHETDPKLGVIGTWLFYDEDFVPELAQRKMCTFGERQQVMVHGFVQGSGYVMKRALCKELGPIRSRESFTGYCIRAAYRSWVNGWPFPFIHQEHMDDARSPHFPFQTESEFQQNLSLSKRQFGVLTLKDAKEMSRTLALRAQSEVIDPGSFFGWRGLVRRVRRKLGIPKALDGLGATP